MLVLLPLFIAMSVLTAIPVGLGVLVSSIPQAVISFLAFVVTILVSIAALVFPAWYASERSFRSTYRLQPVTDIVTYTEYLSEILFFLILLSVPQFLAVSLQYL